MPALEDECFDGHDDGLHAQDEGVDEADGVDGVQADAL
jgi:hypothetical protein